MLFMMRICSYLISVVMMLFFSACSTIPEGVTAVSPFDINRYTGKWYEIARFDHSFERGLNNVTAEYSLISDGVIRVVNSGYDYENKIWKSAVGKAKFVGDESVGMLKVSFFWLFYSGYNVIALDREYRYAMVSGPGLNYLWILSREKTIPEKVKISYLEKARKMGFDISNFLWIEHD